MGRKTKYWLLKLFFPSVVKKKKVDLKLSFPILFILFSDSHPFQINLVSYNFEKLRVTYRPPLLFYLAFDFQFFFPLTFKL